MLSSKVAHAAALRMRQCSMRPRDLSMLGVRVTAEPALSESEWRVACDLVARQSRPQADQMSRVIFPFDLHNFRSASVREPDRVAHVRGE